MASSESYELRLTQTPSQRRRPNPLRGFPDATSSAPAKVQASTEKTKKKNDYGDIIRDSIVGFADGLFVPFALCAGLSQIGSAKLVTLAGLAELFSGSISMGSSAYLAAVTERDAYICEENRERERIRSTPNHEREEVFTIMQDYGVDRDSTEPLLAQLENNHQNWLRFMMDFQYKLEKPNLFRAWISAATMGGAYFLGGIIPMIPYFAMEDVTHALFVSSAITFVILFVFGYGKNYSSIGTTRAGFKGAVEAVIVGALAAGASYGIVRALTLKSPGLLA